MYEIERFRVVFYLFLGKEMSKLFLIRHTL